MMVWQIAATVFVLAWVIGLIVDEAFCEPWTDTFADKVVVFCGLLALAALPTAVIAFIWTGVA